MHVNTGLSLDSPIDKDKLTYVGRGLITMANETLRQRKSVQEAVHGAGGGVTDEHPGGDIKHGRSKELLRLFLLLTYFLSSSFS